MKAVILAAGKGTRMGAMTADLPKALIPVAGRPVLEHIVRRLHGCGIDDFVLVTRYLAEKVRHHFGDGSTFGVRTAYAPQSERYGTGAALLAAKDFVVGEPVLMTYGDIVTPAVNYAGALRVFAEQQCDAVMTLNWMDDPWAGGAVHVNDEGRVYKIVEKPPRGDVSSHWNSAGIFVFRPAVFDYLERLSPSPRGEYELPDALNAMILDGLSICPYYLQGSWRDVGTPADVAAAEEILKAETL